MYTYFIDIEVIKIRQPGKILYRLNVYSEDCCRPAIYCTNKNYFFVMHGA